MSTNARKLPSSMLKGLAYGAVVLAAVWTFAVQPMLAKRLLRSFGATWEVWAAAVFYYQGMFFAGSCWTRWLTRKPAQFQLVTTLALGVAAILSYHLPDDSPGGGAISAMLRLALSSAPSLLFLFSVPSLFSVWFADREQPFLPGLFALWSGAGAIGLLIYPFFVERSLAAGEQLFFSHAFLIVVAAAIAVILYFASRDRSLTPDVESIEDTKLPIKALASWAGFSCCAWLVVIGATYHIVAELGSIPVAWVLPMAIYLVTLVLVFSGRWAAWMTTASLVGLAIALSGFMVNKGFSPATLNGSRALWLLFLTAMVSCSTAALMLKAYAPRSTSHLFLGSACGGFLAALLSVAIVPRLFSSPAEVALASCLALALGLATYIGRIEIRLIAVLGAVLFAPVIMLGIHQRKIEAPGGSRVSWQRDLMSILMVRSDERSLVASRDTTIEGTQLTSDASTRKHPTLYSTESSGVGRVLQRMQETRPKISVAVFGVSSGALAAFARPGDVFDFFDFDSKMIEVARDRFTFIKDSKGTVSLAEVGGRRGLESTQSKYDVIVIDSFPGDGIPAYFLTRQAIALYKAHLSPSGIIVINASARYMDLWPIVSATAQVEDRIAFSVLTEIKNSKPDLDWDAAKTEYIILPETQDLGAVMGWFPKEEDDARVTRRVLGPKTGTVYPDSIWTDERNSVMDVLRLGEFLLSQ